MAVIDLSPLALLERLESALRHRAPEPLPALVARRKPDSAWPVVYYKVRDGQVTHTRVWAHSRAHPLVAHNDEARYAGATHFAAWSPTGVLRYNGPVLNALGEPEDCGAACERVTLGMGRGL